MTVLAAIMIVAGYQAVKFADIRSIWAVGGTARWAIAITFLATLLTSIPVAVGLGVLLTLVLFIYRAGQLTEVHELVRDDDGAIHVEDGPAELRSGEVTVLDAYGPLYFAAALGKEVVLVPGEEILGASLRDAVRQAQAWVEGRDDGLAGSGR